VPGKTKIGEVAVRTEPIGDSIYQVMSIDLVTKPGAKGSIDAMYESWIGLGYIRERNPKQQGLKHPE